MPKPPLPPDLVAFLAEPNERSGYDGYWAEHTLLRFLLAHS